MDIIYIYKRKKSYIRINELNLNCIIKHDSQVLILCDHLKSVCVTEL